MRLQFQEAERNFQTSKRIRIYFTFENKGDRIGIRRILKKKRHLSLLSGKGRPWDRLTLRSGEGRPWDRCRTQRQCRSQGAQASGDVTSTATDAHVPRDGGFGDR